ncbi:hypothetical protein N7462_005771 [Penicillium macrosclerotiorum]|uniref:uncharacterized protein n=1 Tax=Penicillium macrosclerotiorum TaxID=303699 RepID=UPI002546E585|nr:uncharacterized protein N7462_005771 [Penicillium macrosclerotiorum]KAJ5682606.1 hypothetical protein N7462_005771 [Penicillium macrosclerotiorum]
MVATISPSVRIAPSLAFLLGLLLCALHALAEETAFFKSRPDIYPPVFHIEHSEPDKLAPGYIFITPYEAQNPGPYIFDNKGELVWSGWGVSGPGNAHGMHVCKYKGADHLCFFQGNQQKGYCRGHGVILDNQYRIVRSVQPGGGMASSDMHEFLPINDGKTALMTVYQQRQFDMTPWNVKTGVGWLMESVFQEVDVETSKVLFEWRSLDHVDPSMSYTYPAHTDTSGTGLNVHEPWDYFHINSIDKNADGDYLVSSRHTCAIYKISGRDGSVIWRLHGAEPTFRNINFSFSQQHDARWLFENATHSVISLYNNGFNGFNRTHTYSAGMIILIDHVENTALQIRDYKPRIGDLVSSSQGNLQRLPNKNAFIGWGNNPYVSEHDEAGNLVFWATFARDTVMNYRAQKFEWEGNPTDSPALWAYSRTAEPFSPTSFYVSWNGATRVKTWRFYGAHNMSGPYIFLDEVAKTGFETEYTNASFYLWTHVQAVDVNGVVLGQSELKYTFVPSPELRDFCQDATCLDAPGYGFPGEDAAQPFIPPAGVNTVPWVDPDHNDGAMFSYPSGFPHSAPADSVLEYHRKTHNGRLMIWGLVLVIAIPILGGCYLGYRFYLRREQLDFVDEHESSEPLNGMAERKASSERTTDLPWWDYRRWVSNGETRYFPLADRGARSPGRERND